MANSQVNCLMDIQEKYSMAEELTSLKAPETEPYKTKYAASAMLSILRTEITQLIDGSRDEEFLERLSAMLAAIWLNIGIISYETEDLSASSEELKKSLEITKDKAMHPRFVITRINALNHLGLLYSMLEQPQKSKEYLEEAEDLYKNLSELKDPIEAFGISDLFKADTSDLKSPRTKAESDLEKSHTLTLYYLAQIYGTLEDHLKSSVYCHNTLKRQLESKDYDPIEWALNAATLSQFFMERNGFKQARHHLAAASYVLEKYFEEHIKNIEGSSEEDEAKKERYRHRSADVARCWSKYGLLLLESSKERLMSKPDDTEDQESPTTDLAKQLAQADTTTSKDDISGLLFSTLEIPTYENQITDKFVLDYEDALPVFQCTKHWLEDAKTYYTLNEHASDFVRITQDCSALFQVLTFFESDEKRQCQMHKRRVDMLENVVSSLNHQCYLQLCRQIWYELGETYFEMLHIKLGKIREENTDGMMPDPRVLNKLNTLTQKSIDNFGHFLSSMYKDGSSIKEIKLEPECVRPVLSSHFFRGRLFSRLITCDTEQKIENNRKSLASFKFIVDYCTAHPEAEKQVSLELPVCKEMVELLPHKIRQLSTSQIN
ncbi:KIF-binding protein [Frankliniella fusca]|uniref:KIF-binding protein n=1 Tax=Frankliniella fusca TaxID=407009 RepID=A0AAE1LRI5_9NEOP|nr:KIF-binding protein [Frankliniella fusca]